MTIIETLEDGKELKGKKKSPETLLFGGQGSRGTSLPWPVALLAGRMGQGTGSEEVLADC